MVEHERQAVAHEAQRHIGGQAQHVVGQYPADVVAAPGGLGHAGTPVGQRARTHDDARVAGQRTHLADQADRPVEAVVLAPARREIDDFQGAAMLVAQHGAKDGGVGQVALFAVDHVLQLDAEVTAFLLVGAEQGAEGRVAIEGRQAAPDDARVFVDQRAEAAIADHAQIQIGFAHDAGSLVSCRGGTPVGETCARRQGALGSRHQ